MRVDDLEEVPESWEEAYQRLYMENVRPKLEQLMRLPTKNQDKAFARLALAELCEGFQPSGRSWELRKEALRLMAAEYGAPWEIVDQCEYAGKVAYARRTEHIY